MGRQERHAGGDRLDVLARLIAYEAKHYPMDPPDPIEAIKQYVLTVDHHERIARQRLDGEDVDEMKWYRSVHPIL